MRTKILVLVAMLLCVWYSNNAYAQFYDADDEIVFYKLYDESNYRYTCAKYFAMNFDGRKACSIHNYCNTQKGLSDLQKEMLDDEFYFEKKIFENGNHLSFMHYSSEDSDYNSVVYTRTENQFTVLYGTKTYFFKYVFSKDRSTLKFVNPKNNGGGYIIYKRITKDEFYKDLRDKYSKSWRSRSSSKSTIYE